MEKKKSMGFNIIKDDSTSGHGGYGVGAISLNNVTPVIIDSEKQEAFIDMGALHARSAVEKGIKMIPNREGVPNGKVYWVVWVTVHRNEKGPYYHGLGACELFIDSEAKRGYKSMPQHVNNMDKSIKGRVIVDIMDEESKKVLRQYLQSYNHEMWDNSAIELKDALRLE
ncbi:YwhD family protein [Calidifontibacillus oryziterrae]|uniref:YwhD family protein n=1 Tax=Calidifontibacillus oryziterrae TaxID=1191699 RepID=UPI000302CB00|nr:YwhD family protein [Calidifontibacillus oryziterrae]